MKKLFFISILILLSASVLSAKTKPTVSIDGNFQIPVFFNLKSSDDGNDKDITGAAGGNLQFQILFTPYIGALLEAGFFFPFARMTEDNDGERTVRHQDYFSKWFGFNAFLGPTFKAVDTRIFSLFISPGYMMAFQQANKEEANYKLDSIIHGFGVNLNGRFNVNKRMYIHLSEELGLYVYRWRNEETPVKNTLTGQTQVVNLTSDRKCTFLSLNESIGLGFKF